MLPDDEPGDTIASTVTERAMAMGYNRAGTRRTKRLKRSKREMTRLAAKIEATTNQPAASKKEATAKK
jgi:hypothetical protein